MALSINECDRMMRAANETGRHLFVGHVLPFFPEYAYVKAPGPKTIIGSGGAGPEKRLRASENGSDSGFDQEYEYAPAHPA